MKQLRSRRRAPNFPLIFMASTSSRMWRKKTRCELHKYWIATEKSGGKPSGSSHLRWRRVGTVRQSLLSWRRTIRIEPIFGVSAASWPNWWHFRTKWAALAVTTQSASSSQVTTAFRYHRVPNSPTQIRPLARPILTKMINTSKYLNSFRPSLTRSISRSSLNSRHSITHTKLCPR